MAAPHRKCGPEPRNAQPQSRESERAGGERAVKRPRGADAQELRAVRQRALEGGDGAEASDDAEARGNEDWRREVRAGLAGGDDVPDLVRACTRRVGEAVWTAKLRQGAGSCQQSRPRLTAGACLMHSSAARCWAVS